MNTTKYERRGMRLIAAALLGFALFSFHAAHAQTVDEMADATKSAMDEASKEVGKTLKGVEGDLRDGAATPDGKKRPVFTVEEKKKKAKADAKKAGDKVKEVAEKDAKAEADAAAVAPDEPEEAPSDVKQDDGKVDEKKTRRSRRSRRAARGAGGSFAIKDVEIRGDSHLLEALDLVGRLEQDTIGKELSERDIQAIARDYNKEMVQAGYYLARMWTPPTDYSKGVLVFSIDEGRVGETKFYKKGAAGEKQPYDGRFSAKQLQRKLGAVHEGAAFDYNEFYKSVFRVNSHPDLTVDTDLKVRKERTDDGLKRFVDMDFFVEDSLPIHGALEVQNSGTDVTEEWRAALTLQHLNLTKHDDVLTLNAPVSLDFDTLLAVAGSYYLPHYMGNGGAFTLYGGYSELSSDDIVPQINLEGEGYFAGVQGTYKLIDSDAHQLNVSLGYGHQVIEDTLVLEDEGSILPREVTIAPFSLVFSYSSVRPDGWGGRTFLSSQSSANIGDFLGSSNDEEVGAQRETAEADYYVERIQLARIQPTFGGDGDESKKWIIFTKLDGQIASGALIPAEQKAVGGLDNVRGYEQREVLADNGVSGTIELRSPIWSSSYFAGMLPGDAGGGSERLQLVGFLDGAQMYLEDALEGEEDEFTLFSVGAGFRVAFTQHAQVKFDWGFPIEETAVSDSGGRGHISAELQF